MSTESFEEFKAKKELERLKKKVQSSASVRCPSTGGLKSAKQSSPGKPAFDPDRSWIY